MDQAGNYQTSTNVPPPAPIEQPNGGLQGPTSKTVQIPTTEASEKLRQFFALPPGCPIPGAIYGCNVSNGKGSHRIEIWTCIAAERQGDLKWKAQVAGLRFGDQIISSEHIPLLWKDFKILAIPMDIVTAMTILRAAPQTTPSGSSVKK